MPVMLDLGLPGIDDVAVIRRLRGLRVSRVAASLRALRGRATLGATRRLWSLRLAMNV
jgi:hypothetical protein